MGWKTNADIATFREAVARGEASYKPSEGEELRLLNELEERSKEFLKVLALERSGERDGDGYWHGSDAFDGTFEDLRRSLDSYEISRDGLHDGGCPICAGNDGYRNLRRVHFCFCEKHKKKWNIGENLYSSWRHETEKDWRENAEFLAGFEECKPIFQKAAASIFSAANDQDSVPF